MKVIKNLLKKESTLTIAMLVGTLSTFALASFTAFARSSEHVPNEILRLHILADSNSEEDQAFKYQLRDYVLENISPKLENSRDLDCAIERSNKLLPQIQSMTHEFAYSNSNNANNHEITTELVEMYFTTRRYGNITLPAGNYQALRIVIGSGEGDNWWCVMFPLLCVSAFTENPAHDVIEVPDCVAEASENTSQVKFALFEFFSGLFAR
ncbi:MAG: stage II sporulation protein R [Oscillospiraceae bacterium]|nr:stage II sporulation protein R [Oscillospiraceae bacterium]